MAAPSDVKGFLQARWRVWMPPIVLTLVVFAGLLLFVHGSKLTVFAYKLF